MVEKKFGFDIGLKVCEVNEGFKVDKKWVDVKFFENEEEEYFVGFGGKI